MGAVPVTELMPPPEPDPLNCVNAKSFAPTMAEPVLLVHTKPLSAFVSPCWTKTNDDATLSPDAKSLGLCAAPEDCTTHMPFCDASVWSLRRTRSSATNV